ncbi:unannotated protein [freshwater metagenome]|uniref:Unannotated protein n=1 Tax=freshwater metagenome TaxID=449393 RepID=A0A6J6KUY6_9ZZZZ|nr:hypothetical protein [Actinomycetota bacterium]
MENDLAAQISADITLIKERIANLSQLDLAEHSDAFEEVHRLLQHALSNLDGI